MCQYFRVFFTPISTKIDTIDDIITSCAILHNLMRNQNLSSQNTANVPETTSELPQIFIDLVAHKGRSQTAGKITRDKFVSYFMETRKQAANIEEGI